MVYLRAQTAKSQTCSQVKRKPTDEDTVEAEGHEVKRLGFDIEDEVGETVSHTVSIEGSAGAEEPEAAFSPPEKDRESQSRQHCTDEEEEDEEEEEKEFFMSPRQMVSERKNQEKESDDALAVNEEPSEEGTHMEDSGASRSERSSLGTE
ncbi:serine/threonine-protein phosphatase 4 regulatory subunit 2-like protein [Cricetulus griseus]|uniref:Serine/threonine-protein phosphatase 4 regulatory subunit 2-like protein n=1 Tax=Cricetulus griseus TaxID=10029 RepID=A0A061IKG6_CRIGR|nr:serine/threonine-protein phosphatase 4 regulatory subunit 2-like protein [Cricetulus griseus]